MNDVFQIKPAVRESVPLLLGLIGPSGTGKTYSALRLATGIQRVSGGEIIVIDTESRRALHYADQFKFQHLAFGAPFGPLRYLAAIDAAINARGKIIIVDSMSHEHEGPGGILEMHEQECERLMKSWRNATRDKVQLSAWAAPKAERRRMINSILQRNVHFLFCFRAKEKLKVIPGKQPEQRGVMPIAGEEFVYEMTANMLLLPGGRGGEPCWASEYEGEKLVMKRPRQFADMLSGAQLTEDMGEQMARWAAGGVQVSTADPVELVMSYEACTDAATFRVLEDQRRAAWAKLDAAAKKLVKAESDKAKERIDSPPPVPPVAAPEPVSEALVQEEPGANE